MTTEKRVFLTLIVLSFLLMQWTGWYETSLFALTRAIVEEGRTEITSFARETGDWVQIDDRYYIPQAPGISLLIIPIHAFSVLAFSIERPPENENTETTFSDMIKAMERNGYFDKEYFFETVKMFRNIYETVRKIFDGTPLENWAGKQLQENIEAVTFKQKGTSLQLLFQRNEIKKINQALKEALSQRNRSRAFFVLLKNSAKLIKTPLMGLALDTRLMATRKSSSKKNLIVNFRMLEGKKRKRNLLRSPRIWLMPVSLYSSLPTLFAW